MGLHANREKVLFELSNEDRVAILNHLKAESLTQSSLARKIGITRQEVGRHVQRLFNVNLIKRKNSGKIALSEYGETILYALSGLDFITSNHDYFQIHRIRHIPRRFFSRLDELTGCILNTDPMSVFHSIQNMSANAQEFIWRMTDKHLNIAHPYHQAAVDRGVQFRLIESKIYTPAPGVPKSLKR